MSRGKSGTLDHHHTQFQGQATLGHLESNNGGTAQDSRPLGSFQGLYVVTDPVFLPIGPQYNKYKLQPDYLLR